MDKQMIEEMEKTLYDYYFHYDDCIGGSERYLAKYLIEKGWIKPAENAVVLTREEQDKLYQKGFYDGKEFAEKFYKPLVKAETSKETAEKFVRGFINDILPKIMNGHNEKALQIAMAMTNYCKEIMEGIK